MDTESFFIRTTALNHEYCMRKLAPLIDFFNYDKDHPSYEKSHQNEFGKYKDETAGKAILQFLRIRSKVQGQPERWSRLQLLHAQKWADEISSYLVS